MSRIEVIVNIIAPLEKVWDCWTQAEHVKHWNFASDDWHCPEAHNTLEEGKEFHYLMAAKDGSFSFDFWGTFTQIEPLKNLEITLGDGRQVSIHFIPEGEGVLIKESFEPENQNPTEMQHMGWQMILNNFKKYVEQLSA
ncbi:SRPBCC domain-containing protein [Aquirufa rosea]|uniref:Polyketide cyclase n=1 Tax=Aquirufa rosea TaxID=2509241 RepID=A0A4Q1BZ01_9BACT|nr:SRPBCC domain-containing protein [Aquirufa rosea]RXK48772.1 polyketide cyclase [Aquirufa rosea]